MQTLVHTDVAQNPHAQTSSRAHTGDTDRNAPVVSAPSTEGHHLYLRDTHGRLPQLLRTLQQTEVCLSVRQVVRLAHQPAQVVVQVVGSTPPHGVTFPLRCHTFEVESDYPPLVVGQYIRMRQDGPLGVRLEQIPLPPT
jgi:hypothetical protein